MGKLTDLLRLAGNRGHELGLPYAGALTPTEAWEVWQLAPGARLIDVRTRAEWHWIGRIPGAVEIEWESYPEKQANADFLQQLLKALFETLTGQFVDHRPFTLRFETNRGLGIGLLAMECYPAWIVIAFGLSIPGQHMLDRNGQLIQMAEGIAVNILGKLVAQLGDPLLGGRIEGLVGIGAGA